MSVLMDCPSLVVLPELDEPSRPGLDTAELVAAAKDGDRQAWQRLVVRSNRWCGGSPGNTA